MIFLRAHGDAGSPYPPTIDSAARQLGYRGDHVLVHLDPDVGQEIERPSSFLGMIEELYGHDLIAQNLT